MLNLIFILLEITMWMNVQNDRENENATKPTKDLEHANLNGQNVV